MVPWWVLWELFYLRSDSDRANLGIGVSREVGAKAAAA